VLPGLPRPWPASSPSRTAWSPTINCENLDPEIDPNLNLTLNKAQKREVRCALSNTFGFGGHNSTVIFRKI
jgi:fabF: beta-ketoacyl-acyl-carrier-protein synthase II